MAKHNIIYTLHQNCVWLQFNNFNIYRDASFGWFKYLGTTITLQHYTKLRIDNYLRNIKLETDEITNLTTIDISHNNYGLSPNTGKRNRTNHYDDKDELKEIVFPHFHISPKFFHSTTTTNKNSPVCKLSPII